MMQINFTKMHGAGNDYVYVDCFTQTIDDPNGLSILVSDRHKGIGSDGLVLICPSDTADAKMRMFNADGSEGNMCGNAIRCVARYIYEHNIAHKDIVSIETKSGIKTINIRTENGSFVSAEVDMGKAITVPSDIPMDYDGESFISCPVSVGGTDYLCTAVSMGNPHCVTFVDDVDSIEIEKTGPLFENHPLFPDRVNTEFIHVVDSTHLEMRVWERGSGETMACGTGSCAAVVAAVLCGHCSKDTPIQVKLRGGVLTDTYKSDGTVMMEGPASVVFSGVIDTDELAAAAE